MISRFPSKSKSPTPTPMPACSMTSSLRATPRDALPVEAHVVRHEEIEIPVAVVIKKRAARAEARLGIRQSSFLCDIRKCAIAVIPIERILSPVCNEEVFKAVVVVITHRHAVGEARPEQSRLFGHVRESSIAVIPIKPV